MCEDGARGNGHGGFGSETALALIAPGVLACAHTDAMLSFYYPSTCFSGYLRMTCCFGVGTALALIAPGALAPAHTTLMLSPYSLFVWSDTVVFDDTRVDASDANSIPACRVAGGIV